MCGDVEVDGGELGLALVSSCLFLLHFLPTKKVIVVIATIGNAVANALKGSQCQRHVVKKDFEGFLGSNVETGRKRY